MDEAKCVGGAGVAGDLVTGLLPVLGRSLDIGFNVFDVMHHGIHEKQLSNVFRWLLDADGTHGLDSRFTRIFVDKVNQRLGDDEPLPLGGYWVRQEVNTSVDGVGADIADLVLESESVRIVVENYFTSDGHGHDYGGYLAYSRRDDRRGVVVLLCAAEDRSLQTLGWENAPVLTYGTLIDRLHDDVAGDAAYCRKNPEAVMFIEQMHRKFGKGRGRMDDEDVLGFIVAMCDSGEAKRYGLQPQSVAAEQFATDLAEQARHRFGEGRDLLRQVKKRLRSFSDQHLQRQLHASFGDGFVHKVRSNYQGIFEWTVYVDIDAQSVGFDETRFGLVFGPTAWFTNEREQGWKSTVDPEDADYSHVFFWRKNARVVRQSSVTLREVLDGLEPSDARLHDEILEALSDTTSLSR